MRAQKENEGLIKPHLLFKAVKQLQAEDKETLS